MAPPNEPTQATKIKCPGCELELNEDDVLAQMEHMERNHPEIIDQRRRESGFFIGRDGKWHDGWASD